MAFVNRGLLGLVLLALMAYMQLTCAMGEETPTKAAVQDAGKAVAAEPATEANLAYKRYDDYHHSPYYNKQDDDNPLWDALKYSPEKICPAQCSCECRLTPVRNDTGNGCVAGCTSGLGGLCTEADPTIPTAGGNCRNCLNAWTPTWAYCRGAGGNLCYHITCPSNGRISLYAQAASGATGGCTGCNPLNYLNLYQGPDMTGTLLRTNQRVITYDEPCNEGDVFTMCELQGIFLTSTFDFRHYSIQEGSCPAGCTSQCTERS